MSVNVSALNAIKPATRQISTTANKLKTKKTLSAAATIVKQDDPIGTATVTCSALNVRSGAGTNYDRIGGLSYGKSVEVYEEKDGWLRIKYGAANGWICKQYTDYKGKTDTKPSEPETKPSEPETKPEPGNGGNSGGGETGGSFSSFQGKVNADGGLNVRTGPGTGYGRIGGLADGQVITVIGEQNGWYQIEFQGTTGWVSGDFVDKISSGNTTTQPETKPDPQPDPGSSSGSSDKTEIITTDGVNLRNVPGNGSSPAAGSSVLVTIPSGTRLTATAEQNGWYQVEYNGKTGWICGDYAKEFTAPNISGSGPQAAAEYAASFEGSRTKDLIGTIPYLQDLSGISGTNNGYDLNCANFATAILQNFGLIGTHSNTVSGAASYALNFGYRAVSKSQAKPGDLFCNSHHAEIVYSNNGGAVTLVGSNNKGGGDVQYVTKDTWTVNNDPGTIYSLQ